MTVEKNDYDQSYEHSYFTRYLQIKYFFRN